MLRDAGLHLCVEKPVLAGNCLYTDAPFLCELCTAIWRNKPNDQKQRPVSSFPESFFHLWNQAASGMLRVTAPKGVLMNLRTRLYMFRQACATEMGQDAHPEWYLNELKIKKTTMKTISHSLMSFTLRNLFGLGRR